MNLKPYEAIIIGSGATGGVASLTLAKAGVRVLVIEAGPELSVSNAFGSEPQNTIKRLFSLINGEHRKQAQHPGFWKTNPLLYANEKENIYTTPKDKPFLWTQGKQVGGKSLTWGGITLRLSDYDFKASQNDGYGSSWPIDYSELSSHYSKLENLLRVYGNKDGLQQLPDGEYIGAIPFTKSEEYFSEKVKSKLGYKVIHSRGFEAHELDKSKENWPRYSSPGCTLKIALSTGNVEILSGHIAERLVMSSNRKKAKGIIVIDKNDNKRTFLEAELIILCASTIQSLRFLLSSKENNIENGFIEPSDSLGEKLMDHVSTCRFFSFSNNSICNKNELNLKHQKLSGAGSFFIPFGNNNTIFKNTSFIRGYGIWGAIDRFEPPKILKRKPNSKIGFLIGHGEVLADKNNKVILSKKIDKWGISIPHIDLKWGKNEIEMIAHMNKTIEEIIISSGGEVSTLDKLIHMPFIEKLAMKSFALQKQAPPPGYYIHEVGGAPMGEFEESSVVDKWNRLWQCQNVLVVDGACWPTSAWQSPTLTMMAITRRACLKAIKP